MVTKHASSSSSVRSYGVLVDGVLVDEPLPSTTVSDMQWVYWRWQAEKTWKASVYQRFIKNILLQAEKQIKNVNSGAH